ncbi:MAG: metallophosphoesterase [Planctomycetia bacterium]|nr:metallophosphoesterase [Planctomycetia bacterium]
MPIHLPAVGRRQFLRTSVAAGVGLLTVRWTKADALAADGESWALLSDTHLSGDRDEIKNEVHLFKNLDQVLNEVRGLPQRPSGLLVNGDLAMLDGQPADYQLLAEMMSTVTAADIPVHLSLGNHDHRENFWQAIANQKAPQPPVESRQITVIESPRVNWLLLDSLVTTNEAPGTLGETQLHWLVTALDAQPDKPAIVMVHHNPDPKNPKSSALTDTDALFEILLPRRQVKAYVFGHTHHWSHREYEGIHFVNLPPTAYPFQAGDPNGWVHCTLNDHGAKFELRAIDAKHPKQGETLDLKWRT